MVIAFLLSTILKPTSVGMEELTMARSNFAWEENMYKSELEEVSNYNAQQRNVMHVPPPCSPSYGDIVSHHTRSNVQHSTTEVDACCRFEGATADFTVAPQSTTQSATDTIPNSFEAADLSTTVSEIDGTSSMQLQTPVIFSASLSICTDFMGQSRTHSLSSSYAGSQPSSCCTSPRILPVHDLVQHFEDNSDTVSEVDCTLSLGTAATRKREWSHTRTQMSRCGSPARVADNGSSRFMFVWPPASSGPKLIDSSLHSTYQNLEQFVNRRSHEDHFSGHLGLDGVSKTRSFFESQCTIFYPGCKDMLSSQRTWTPSLGESQVFNEAILNLLPSNRGSEFLSPLRPTYSTNQCSANPGSMLQFATGKTLIDQCNVPRTCAHCGTSKTPLWRNGPMGPKSLCNACGIRYKKVGRRACSYARS